MLVHDKYLETLFHVIKSVRYILLIENIRKTMKNNKLIKLKIMQYIQNNFKIGYRIIRDYNI